MRNVFSIERLSRVTAANLLLALLPPFITAATADAADAGERGWWLKEPVRFFQTNLPETDSTLDPQRYVDQVADLPANTILFNMGGIVAQYPTEVPFHYASAYLPPGRDLFGDVLREAHARGIRVIGRFDLSKTLKPVYDAHPEWFFKNTKGEPAVYNGTYHTCINGDYYHVHAMKILTEALENYEVDGLFFNMFGNPGQDYSGNPLGPCQCDACQERFRARYGRALPETWDDDDYREFMAASSRETAARIAELIHRLRPDAAFLTYLQEYTDIIMEESTTVSVHSMPPWTYLSSDNVNRSRTSEPGKAVFNMAITFVDYPWRYVSVPGAQMQMWLYQNMAHGGAPAVSLAGTPDQQDRQSLLAAKVPLQWHARHEELYVGQENAARILLLHFGDEESYRGLFRLLSEQHIPFAATDNLKWLDDSGRRYDLVIAPGGAAPELARYVNDGGRLLIAGANPPPDTLPIARVVNSHRSAEAVWRIHDHADLPSLTDTDLIMLDGDYVELEPPKGGSLLTLVPPAMFGPPEKVWADKIETTVPGLIFARQGEGQVAYIPWDVGGTYYRRSSEGHAGLLTDVIDRLLPRGRQIKTDAHPLIEITVMRQPQHNRTLVHLVNLSGHSENAFFPPIDTGEIRIEIDESYSRARAVSLNQFLPVTTGDSGTAFTLPRLGPYEVIVLQ